MKLLAIFVCGEAKTWRYLGSLDSSQNSFGHFVFRIFGQHEVLFDTGSDPAWLVTDVARPRTGFRLGSKPATPCSEVVTYGVEGQMNTFTGTRCLVDSFWVINNGPKWTSKLSLSDTPVSWWQWDGIVGGSLNSDFVRAFPKFKIVPTRHKSKYNMFVMRQSVQSSSTHSGCATVRLTPNGVATNRWIVSGKMRVQGGAWLESDFAIDTGFPSIALRSDMWEQTKRIIASRGGIVTGQVVGSYGQVVRNCVSLQMIPSVEYLLEDRGAFRMRIPGSAFAMQQDPQSCIVYAITHPGGHSFLGVAFLRRTIITFNAAEKNVEICKIK